MLILRFLTIIQRITSNHTDNKHTASCVSPLVDTYRHPILEIQIQIRITYFISFQNDIDLEPKDQNDKTPLNLAISHRHMDIVYTLHAAIKKRSGWLPSVSEIWGLLFGKAGNSKAPLLFFVSSVLLWGYPMYIVRVSVFLIIIINVILWAKYLTQVNFS